ncbi:DUF2969 family protein [Weissella ceti]|uniref:DUF2969 family protein n=1 Tax=Weissella ceti TaxID=759620 RepID=A0ABT3E6L3_9LACO|nr:DUF2969 family protein [Weissella ceti]MCW0953578.1 DUF2969 family protein [Weissella ceti]QVK12201.1 DUF2969 family protein [Weissella ceti]
MARNNKPVAVEMIDTADGRTEVKINKVSLGFVDDTNKITFSDGRTNSASDFDSAVAMLIADFNLHH